MERNRSWLALVMFCATTALVAALGLAILIASATVAFALARTLDASTSNPNGEEAANPALQAVDASTAKTYSGVVTDDHCLARHAMDSKKGPAECAQMCVRSGSNYALVDGDRKYVLDGNQNELDKLAGQRASVRGTAAGGIIKVDSVTAAQ